MAGPATPARRRWRCDDDPLQAAAAFVRAVRERAEAGGALATVGALRTEPPTPTAIPAAVHCTLDLRHRETRPRCSHWTPRPAAWHGGAAEREGCTVERRAAVVDRPDPLRPGLVARATALAGEPLTSGPLHDAAAVARAGVPSVMLFARTHGGVSHSREEDAREQDLVVAIEAFAALVDELLRR